MQTPTRTVRMTEELYQRLVAEAKKQDKSFSALVVQIVEKHLAQQKENV